MRTASLITLLLLLAYTASGQPIVIKNVSVIDVRSATVRPGRTVVIIGNRIESVGAAGKPRTPVRARVIDATGKFLIPGLWDMHAHLGSDPFDRDYNLKLFVTQGVTGVRFMDGDPIYHEWRRSITSGQLLGPRMIIASQMLGFGELADLSDARARTEVKNAAAARADFIKVHDSLSATAYRTIVIEAKRLGLNVAGHVPASITADVAADSGQVSIEHSSGLEGAKADQKVADVLISKFLERGMWLCPTLVMRYNYATLDNPKHASDSRLRFAKPSWRRRWLGMSGDADKISGAEWTARADSIRKEKSLLAKMSMRGVGILAGTDVPNPFVLPGFGLQDELKHLVEAGLTPAEALRAATYNPAKFLGRLDSLGAVEKGKLADLLLLDANPLEDISNTDRIEAVFLNGQYLSRDTLQKIREEIATAARGN